MAKAFVETTILTNILLKPGEIRRRNQAALSTYTRSELPTYAIKEFKAGPLSNYVWAYNKLVNTGSLSLTLTAIGSILRFKPYTASTALEAISAAAQTVVAVDAETAKLYGKKADPNQTTFDVCRLTLKRLIIAAWKRRRLIADEVVLPLSCFNESGPKELDGLFALDGKKCEPQVECPLGVLLKRSPELLIKLRKAVDAQPAKTENERRSKVLRELIRNPKRPCTEMMCRYLGDAIFAFFAPVDSVVLTTNIKDLKPLVEALGKTASDPMA